MQRLPPISGGETRDETAADVLVPPIVPPSKQGPDTLTAELLAIWSELDDDVLDDFRTRLGVPVAETEQPDQPDQPLGRTHNSTTRL